MKHLLSLINKLTTLRSSCFQFITFNRLGLGAPIDISCILSYVLYPLFKCFPWKFLRSMRTCRNCTSHNFIYKNVNDAHSYYTLLFLQYDTVDRFNYCWMSFKFLEPFVGHPIDSSATYLFLIFSSCIFKVNF